MSKPIITKQMLIDADAFTEQVDLFEETFGDSVVVTLKRAEAAAERRAEMRRDDRMGEI